VPENREETLAKIKETGADLGFAWDADADRCFVYNEKGEAVDGSFMGSLLAQIVLEKKEKGQTVIYDPRIVWAVRETVESLGGTPFPTKVGHAFIKHKMREKNAVLAVEGSGHFYFRDFYFCDNGMISALLILCYLSEKKRPLSEILSPLTTRYFVSGEINFTAENKDEIVEALKNDYAEGKFDDLDGISIEYPDFRFNVRKSNTEPLLRLNLEARSAEGLEQKKKELVEKIEKLKK
jgi:phosphomannomutase